MAAPSGTNYPGALDTTTSIGTSVSTGQTITAPYQDIQSSAILAIETALAANPQGSDASVAAALTARARKTDVQNQTVNYADDSGAANAYVVTLTPPWPVIPRARGSSSRRCTPTRSLYARRVRAGNQAHRQERRHRPGVRGHRCQPDCVGGV